MVTMHLLLVTAALASGRPRCETTCAVAGCDYYQEGCQCACNRACADRDNCCSDHSIVCPARPPPAPHGGGPRGGPEQHHLSLTHEVSSVVVSFATARAGFEGHAPTCTVRNASWQANATGTSHTYAADGWQGLLHAVRLADLAPASAYSYACAVADAVGAEHSFVSPPPAGALPVVIGVVGDMGEGCDGAECSNATIRRLKAELRGDGAPFGMLLHVGDIAYTQGVQTVWDEYFNDLEPIAASVPYQVCVGNHEHYHEFAGYLNRFEMAGPGGAPPPSPRAGTPALGKRPLPPSTRNLYHSFDWGGVHIAAFSSEHDLGPQMAWLDADLAATDRARTPWLVVIAHRPIYCSTSDPYDCNHAGPTVFAPALEPLLRRHRVDLALFGHLHNYERTWPVFNGTVTARSYARPAATVHAVVGMSGDREGLTQRFEDPPPAWSARRLAELAYARLTFESAEEMSFELVLADDGTVADSFNITRGGGDAPW